MSLEAIKAAIPHREPFLLIDEIIERTDNHIVCRKTFTGQEFWYAGHYPGFPLTPGVLLLESAMQAGAVLLAQVVAENPDRVPVVSRINNVKFKHMVRPGDSVTLDVTLTEKMAGAFFMDAKVMLGEKLAVMFDFACKMAPTPK
ncbi:MAG TPA: 3-hydroxyacyl-ACP dehydratase FabZ family protein [Lacipirellulaceae bacterium]|jgi:3-hydroxyacyl-[acyl-carrier-protein] dehydratase|nr:3-hydroxyacyl-ACP dehydratase FabZ family protein [Lacipirellulaceae bacterium]